METYSQCRFVDLVVVVTRTVDDHIPKAVPFDFAGVVGVGLGGGVDEDGEFHDFGKGAEVHHRQGAVVNGVAILIILPAVADVQPVALAA